MVESKIPVVFWCEEIVRHDVLGQPGSTHPQMLNDDTLIVSEKEMHTTLLLGFVTR